MSIFIWSDALYATKVPEVDAQHRRLFELTNNFYDAFKQLRGQEELAKLFNELLVYVEEHFALEESLMAKYNFPGYAAHRGLHRELTSLLKDKAERFAAGENPDVQRDDGVFKPVARSAYLRGRP